jgi:molecular chaperone GrpE
MKKKMTNKAQDNIQQQDFEQEIINLKEEVAYNLAGWQRAQADYQNLKKESEKIRVDSIKLANKSLIENFIPVFDNFALATKHLPQELQDNNWVQGIIFIHRQLQDILLAEGVEIIDPKGQVFDPNIHEAVDIVSLTNGLEPNTIVEVLQVGYMLHGSLIRSARVKVSAS